MEQEIQRTSRMMTWNISSMDPMQNEAKKAEERGDLELALQLWKQLAERSADPALYARYAVVAQELEKWDDAEIAFAESIRLDPGFTMAMEGMGDLWATRTDKSDTESFEIAKDWFLKALRSERKARTLTLLGAVYVALDDIPAARNALEEALRINPNYEEALYNLAVLERGTDQQKSAELLEKAIEIDPNYSLAHQELGKIYHRMGNLTKAEYHFRRSIETEPTDYWSHLYLANVLAAQGENVEAEQTFRIAINLRPEIKNGFEFFAQFLDAIGKPHEAVIVRETGDGRDVF
jgi:tetratricopeptide (TPR) repeat protein